MKRDPSPLPARPRVPAWEAAAARADDGASQARRRLERRVAADRRTLTAAVRHLAAALGRTGDAGAEAAPADDPLFEACRHIGRAQGLTFHRPARSGGELDGTLTVESVCDASQVRHRRVLLRGEWWRQDNGPLLAFRRGPTDGPPEPVALVPLSPSRYQLVDPRTGAKQPVDRTVAAALETGASMFYRPLPDRPLTLLDFLRAGLRGLGGEVWRLAAVSAAIGILALLVPLATGRIVASAIPASDRAELVSMTMALIVGALAAALFQIARAALVLRITGKLDASLQAAVWARLLGLPVAFFRRFTVGDLESRAMGVDRLRSLVAGHVTSSILALSYSFFSFLILFYYSWRLALVASAVLALLAFTAVLTGLAQVRHQRALHRVRGRVASLLFALLTGITKLRAAAAEGRGFAAWAHLFALQRRHTVAIQRLAIAGSVSGAVLAVLSVLAFFAMVALSSGQRLEVAGFLAFNVAYGQLQAAALSVLAVLPVLLEAVPVYDRLSPILTASPEVDETKMEAPGLAGRLALRHVSFRYQERGRLVLEDVCIEAGAGEFVALVGPSGSGKSTCLRLLLGFEQPESGSVLYDELDLSALNIQSVRRQIGVVLQNSRPMVGDIFSNIVGTRNLTRDDAWRAARMVGLDDEIRRMPMGMHTFINQRGTTFSGGQRQRVLIARAIVSNPRLVLLDEATSALDNRTQELVMRSLEQLDATRIVVAHRLSTILNADRIYVLDQGRIVECGTYDELIRQDGYFRRIAQRQIA